MTPEETLRSVPAYLDEHGETDEAGRCLPIGVVIEVLVATAGPWGTESLRTIRDTIGVLASTIDPITTLPSTLTVMLWDDESGRTVDDIKAVCIAAANKLATEKARP